jgi:hypothetical protein
MHVESLRDTGVHMAQKVEELLMSMMAFALTQDCSGDGVEGDKQCGGAVSDVVVRDPRRLHRPTVTWFNRNRAAMSLLDKPSALSKTMRTRVTRPWGSERELAIASSCSRCSCSSCNGIRGRPKLIGTSILHRRCLRGRLPCNTYISYLRDTTLASAANVPVLSPTQRSDHNETSKPLI